MVPSYLLHISSWSLVIARRGEARERAWECERGRATAPSPPSMIDRRCLEREKGQTPPVVNETTHERGVTEWKSWSITGEKELKRGRERHGHKREQTGRKDTSGKTVDKSHERHVNKHTCFLDTSRVVYGFFCWFIFLLLIFCTWFFMFFLPNLYLMLCLIFSPTFSLFFLYIFKRDF